MKLKREVCKKSQKIQEIANSSTDFSIRFQKDFDGVCENMGINQISLQEMSLIEDISSLSSDQINRYITPFKNDGTFTPTGSRMGGKNSRTISPPKRDLNIVTIEELHKNYENLYTNRKNNSKSKSKSKKNLERKKGVSNLLEKVTDKFGSNKLLFEPNPSKLSSNCKGSISIPEIYNSHSPNSNKLVLEKTNTEQNLRDLNTVDHSRFGDESFTSEQKLQNFSKNLLTNQDTISLTKTYSNNQSKTSSIIANRIEENVNKNINTSDNMIDKANLNNVSNNNSDKYSNQLIKAGDLPNLLPKSPLKLSYDNENHPEHDIYNPEESSIENHMKINQNILSKDNLAHPVQINLNIQNDFKEYFHSSSSSVKIKPDNEEQINYNINSYDHFSIDEADKRSQNSTFLIESTHDDHYDDILMNKNDMNTQNIDILTATSVPNM